MLLQAARTWSRQTASMMAVAAVGAAGLTTICTALQHNVSSERAKEEQVALSPSEWRAFPLVEKEKLTHNTYRLRFGLPEADQQLGLTVASCLTTRAPVERNEDGSPKFVVRPYTPVSPATTKGHFDLVIKVYPNGKLSPYFETLRVGDTIDCKGPFQKIPYESNMNKRIGMIAGGTGITPMLQVADEILRNPDDKTEVSLLYGNVSEDDIICKKQIDELAAKHKNFKVYYVVDKANYGGMFWKGGVGYINSKLIAEHMPPPSSDNLILVCGPPGLMKAISGDKAKNPAGGPPVQGEVSGALKDLGYTSDMVFKF